MAIGPFDEAARERLSALADGEVDGIEPAAACARWAADGAARRDWHAWHLIGDVLRSEDLASDPARDRQLCAAIRARLQDEPVVLAPMRDAARVRGRWAVGGAVAAGLALVVGTFTLLHPSDQPAPLVAEADRAAVAPVVVPTAPGGQAPGVEDAVVTNAQTIRDAQLDRYLAAHKQFAGTSALGVPSAFLRSATFDTASR